MPNIFSYEILHFVNIVYSKRNLQFEMTSTGLIETYPQIAPHSDNEDWSRQHPESWAHLLRVISLPLLRTSKKCHEGLESIQRGNGDSPSGNMAKKTCLLPMGAELAIALYSHRLRQCALAALRDQQDTAMKELITLLKEQKNQIQHTKSLIHSIQSSEVGLVKDAVQRNAQHILYNVCNMTQTFSKKK